MKTPHMKTDFKAKYELVIELALGTMKRHSDVICGEQKQLMVDFV